MAKETAEKAASRRPPTAGLASGRLLTRDLRHRNEIIFSAWQGRASSKLDEYIVIFSVFCKVE